MKKETKEMLLLFLVFAVAILLSRIDIAAKFIYKMIYIYP